MRASAWTDFISSDFCANWSIASVTALVSCPSAYCDQRTPKTTTSVRVNGNWRITFRFIGADIELVNYQDYH
nr:type II toxin-antitoxin system RelE/ParE family toxin [Bordetella sp. LUAb4]